MDKLPDLSTFQFFYYVILTFPSRKMIVLTPRYPCCLLADVTDSSGVTLAHVAAREGQLTCLQTLVDHGIDVTTDDKDGRSPADYAYAAGQTGCARYLVMEESCWLLSVRIAKLHKELNDCKEENKGLKQRLEAS